MIDTRSLRRAILLALFICSLGSIAFAMVPATRWELTERLGSVWLMRQGGPVPIGETELCQDIPRLDYVQETALPIPERDPQADAVTQGLQETLRKGAWSVRPIHIWGIWSDIGCKEPLGWGTAFLIGLYKSTYIWATVEHNVKTSKYFESIFGREIATNWFIRDDAGNFKELFLVGCKAGKYCILTSSYISQTSPISLDDDVITNSFEALEMTYVYGCSLVGETIKRYEHYKIRFFCLANAGYINSREKLDYLAGGDVLVSNPAMPGFSGAPVFAFRDGRLLVLGTVNAGVSGVFTAVNLLNEDTVSKVKAWLAEGESLFISNVHTL
jgi:hypothetical protein